MGALSFSMYIIKSMSEEVSKEDQLKKEEEKEIYDQRLKKPYKFNEKTRKRLLDSIRLGAFIEHACYYAGINSSTFRRWRDQADKGIEPFASFWNEITVAESEAIIRRVARIEQAGVDGNWQADAWFLERKHPDKFGRRDRVELSGDPNAPIEIDLAWADGNIINREETVDAEIVKGEEE